MLLQETFSWAIKICLNLTHKKHQPEVYDLKLPLMWMGTQPEISKIPKNCYLWNSKDDSVNQYLFSPWKFSDVYWKRNQEKLMSCKILTVLSKEGRTLIFSILPPAVWGSSTVCIWNRSFAGNLKHLQILFKLHVLTVTGF